MWAEALVAYYKVLSWHLPGGTEEYHETLSHDSRCPGLDLNRAPTQYKSEASPLEPTRSVVTCQGCSNETHSGVRPGVVMGSSPSACAQWNVCLNTHADSSNGHCSFAQGIPRTGFI
jgi:hypothetical protein